MKVLKSHEMAEIDRKTIEEIGIPSPVLMENAARAVMKNVLGLFPSPKRVLVTAGKGNNGGDGIALARMLNLKGIKTDLFLALGEPSGDAKLQLDIFNNLGLSPLKEEPNLKKYDLLIDAILGTGFKPPVRGRVAQLIEKINISGVPVVAVDLPSGLSADSGKLLKTSVMASATVTFQFPKVCHILYPAAKACGKLFVEDISIPESLAYNIKRELLDFENLTLPSREPDTYKNKEGHVLVVGGSRGKTGALLLSAMAATKTGSGLVSVGIPEELSYVAETTLIEEMGTPLPGAERLSIFGVETILELQERVSALAVGMGMDRYEEGQDIILQLIDSWEKPILIDADGLNNLADSGELGVLKERKIPAVLTPHVGEFSRLSGLSSEYIIHNLIDVAQEFSSRNRCFLVLKSSRTVIATPEGKAYISTRGTPAMAKGGSGDVLSGILISLMGRMPTEEALRLGVFLHGLAGELAQDKSHMECLKARDIIETIPEAYKSIEIFLKRADTI